MPGTRKRRWPFVEQSQRDFAAATCQACALRARSASTDTLVGWAGLGAADQAVTPPQNQVLVSFGTGSLSKRRSFPRKRIQSLDGTFPKVCGVDSRGNDCGCNMSRK